MKFLGCSQCLSSVDESSTGSSRKTGKVTETCDPLLITRRPGKRATARDKPARKICIVSGGRLPGVLRAIGAPWRRKRRSSGRPMPKLETRRKVKKRDLLREKKKPKPHLDDPGSNESKHNLDDKSPGRNRRLSNDSTLRQMHETLAREPRRIDIRIGEEKIDSPKNDPLDLERDYDEHLEALKFLLECKSPFDSVIEERRSRDALNSLDFRRINTIALPGDSVWDAFDFRDESTEPFGGLLANGKDLFAEESPAVRTRLFRDSVDRVIQENRRVEEAMMSLLGRDVQKKTKSCLSREGSPACRKEAKTVRFKVEDADDNDNETVKRKIDKKNCEDKSAVEKSCDSRVFLPEVGASGIEESDGKFGNESSASGEKNDCPVADQTGGADSLTVKIKIEADERTNDESSYESGGGERVTARNNRNSKISKSSTTVTIYQTEKSFGDRVEGSDGNGSADVMEFNGIIET